MDQKPRRDFLKKAALALPIVAASDLPKANAEDVSGESNAPKEQPWQGRMTAPDDGKKYGWFVDTRRCFGCHACEVSCKSENDVPLGNYIRQTTYLDKGKYPEVARLFLPMSCQHCEDAPCIKVCPCGALHKETGGTVAVDYDICCGHGSCVDACPYGAIYMDPVASQAVKCHNCYHRIEAAWSRLVSHCPAEALQFGDLNDPQSRVSQAIQQAEQEDVELVQLESKKRQSHGWFAGPAATEIETSYS